MSRFLPRGSRSTRGELGGVCAELCETGKQPVEWTACNTWEVPFLKVQSVNTDAAATLLYMKDLYFAFQI